MQLTKGAIGNLINRYKAVLKKCHLLNVFGSLAVAGMLVMGGGTVIKAQEYTAAITGTETDYENIKKQENGKYTYSFTDGDSLKVSSNRWGAINLSNTSASISGLDSVTHTSTLEEGHSITIYGDGHSFDISDTNLTANTTNKTGIAVATGVATYGGENTVTIGNGDIKAIASTTVTSSSGYERAIANGIAVENGSIMNIA